MTVPAHPHQGAGEGELLPCPFCGGTARAKEDDAGRGNWVVMCDECKAESHYSRYEVDAIAAWNRRAPLSPDARGRP